MAVIMLFFSCVILTFLTMWTFGTNTTNYKIFSWAKEKKLEIVLSQIRTPLAPTLYIAYSICTDFEYHIAFLPNIVIRFYLVLIWLESGLVVYCCHDWLYLTINQSPRLVSKWMGSARIQTHLNHWIEILSTASISDSP
jgi:hypothetical protein